jgi:hypothetical protein
VEGALTTWAASESCTGVHQKEVGISDSVVACEFDVGRNSLRASAKLRALFQ